MKYKDFLEQQDKKELELERVQIKKLDPNKFNKYTMPEPSRKPYINYTKFWNFLSILTIPFAILAVSAMILFSKNPGIIIIILTFITFLLSLSGFKVGKGNISVSIMWFSNTVLWLIIYLIQ